MIIWDVKEIEDNEFDPGEILKLAKQGLFTSPEIVLMNRDLYNYDVNLADDEGDTLLHMAVEYGRVELVKKLIGLKSNVNCINKIKKTPLHLAARVGKFEIVKALVSAAAELNIPDEHGETAAFKAAKYNNIEILEFLFEQGERFQTRNIVGDTLMHAAVQIGSFEIVQLLFQIDENWDIHTDYFETPLQQAVKLNRLEIVQFLIEKRFDTTVLDHNKSSLLHLAVMNKCYDVIEFLIMFVKMNVNVQDRNGRTPFYLAVENNDLYIVKLLIKLEAFSNKPDIDGYTPLHCAASCEKKLAIFYSILHLAKKDSVTFNGDLALHRAAAAGNCKAIRSLQQPRIYFNKDGYSPQSLALELGQREALKILNKTKLNTSKSRTLSAIY